MSAQESTKLLPRDKESHLSIDDTSNETLLSQKQRHYLCTVILGTIFITTTLLLAGIALLSYIMSFPTMPFVFPSHNHHHHQPQYPTTTTTMSYKGPFQLVELQQGKDMLQYYDFYDGPDSIGSAGYQTYVNRNKAQQLGLFHIHPPEDGTLEMKSVSNPIPNQPRWSIRLEGKRRWDRGLFVLHVDHIPTGCGTWPAFWLTDEDHWPFHGEIDVVEGVNDQTNVKTALHTSESCSMYAQVSPKAQTGSWDRSTGIPNTFTGILDNETSVPADNCWVMAPHQWANQGCVVTHPDNNTLGAPFNQQGGGIYVLDWDPDHGYIKSWVFPQSQGYPSNLEQAITSAIHPTTTHEPIAPNPDTWNVAPYAYFAIGTNSSCSADHFSNMRLIFNLAFCGTVAGNRFARDCPKLASQYAVYHDQHRDDIVDIVATCNAYIASEPDTLKEAYWKIRGVYIYQRQATNHEV